MNSGRPFLLTLSLVFCLSCSTDRWQTDTSSVRYDARFARLDKAIFNISPEGAYDSLQAIRSSFDPFTDTYLVEIVRVGEGENPMTASLLLRFIQDPVWQELQKIIESRHPDLHAEEAMLENALRRYAVFFDTDSLPQLVAYNSGFNVGIYPSRETLGVGLEWYSGTDFDIIKQLPPDLFPQYKRDKMKPEYLAINALKGWLMFMYQDLSDGDDLLSRMIFSGKVHYLAQVLMENTDVQTLLNYTEEQVRWSEAQEYDIWKHFVENDLIFTTNQVAIGKMMNDGPFTSGMPPESPGGLGNWVGYRMVESYMNKHPDATLPELMRLNDNQRILKSYKPGR